MSKANCTARLCVDNPHTNRRCETCHHYVAHHWRYRYCMECDEEDAKYSNGVSCDRKKKRLPIINEEFVTKDKNVSSQLIYDLIYPAILKHYLPIDQMKEAIMQDWHEGRSAANNPEINYKYTS